MGSLGKSFALLFALTFAASLAVATSSTVKAASKTIVVPDDYPTIQAAVENARSGDTVFVRNGVYNETIVIGRPISLIGEDRQKTIIMGEYWRFSTIPVISVKADCVISGFTIQTSSGAGISVDHESYEAGTLHCNIHDNIITETETGIVSQGKTIVVISGNDITGNYRNGIDIESNNSIISENNIKDNRGGDGIHAQAKNLTINNNNISGNDCIGMELWNGPFYVYGNNITGNRDCGIQIADACSNSTIHDNEIAHNKIGIDLKNYPINEYNPVGVDNTVYRNNIADNTQQAFVKQKLPGLSLPARNGTDVVSWDNGREGNYWSDYKGGGTYVIDENNVDHHPLPQPSISV
jgi:nitrous oxidase accessory protein